MQHVDIKENMEEQQNAVIAQKLSREYTGTLNIQLGSFRQGIAISLIITYLYLG